MVTRKTDRMLALEQEWGEPLETLIPRLFSEENRKLTRVARRLGVNYGTLYAIIGRLGMAVSQSLTEVA